jgi:hypothetical protein
MALKKRKDSKRAEKEIIKDDDSIISGHEDMERDTQEVLDVQIMPLYS